MSILHNISEGGQTWAHKVRMLRQVIRLAVFSSLSLSITVFLFWIWHLPNILHISFWYYIKASLLGEFFDHLTVDSSLWATISNQHHHAPELKVSIERIFKVTEGNFNRILDTSFGLMTASFKVFLWSFAVFILFFSIRGTFSKRKEHISGQRVVPSWKLALKLRLKRLASDIKVGNVPLFKGSETQHILVSGGTGSGKTNCFHNILPQIRNRGDRAVVVDTTGGFIKKYYRPGKDIILNPFDERSAEWHPWSECRDSFDYESIAESFIPHNHDLKDSYWNESARAVFQAVLEKLSCNKNTSELKSKLISGSLVDLCEFVQETDAAAYLDINSEKTAASIRSSVASHLGFLKHLTDTESSFSIRDWVEKDDQDSWLFLSMDMAQRGALRPLVSTWLSIAMRSLLQLEPSFSRRLWYIADELPSLQKLKDFDTFLVEGRKYGGCGLFAIQSPAQLEMIYGRDVTQIVTGNCLTKLAFYEHDPQTAEKLSRMFGERELKEFQEGISYGAHQMRDGVNLSGQVKKQPVVSVTDLQSLRANQAFLRLPGDFPATKIKITVPKNT